MVNLYSNISFSSDSIQELLKCVYAYIVDVLSIKDTMHYKSCLS